MSVVFSGKHLYRRRDGWADPHPSPELDVQYKLQDGLPAVKITAIGQRNNRVVLNEGRSKFRFRSDKKGHCH